MTERTFQMIEFARRIARGEIGIDDRDVVEIGPSVWVQVIVELAGGRPNAIDRHRVEDLGDWNRTGDVACAGAREAACGRLYHEHPVVLGFEWLRRLCDGRLVKL